MNLSKITALFIAIPALLAAFPAMAQDDSPDYTNRLTGGWNGHRAALHDQGIDIDGSYTFDLWRNVSGGAKTGNAGSDNLDLQVNFDGEKLYGLPGSTIFFHFLNNNGGQINSHAGTNGGIDNIEVGTPTAQLYEAWIEQSFLNDVISFRAGLYDLNTEFYVTDTSGLFINPTYGIGTEFAASGQNGPSIFPVTSVGARLLINPTDKIYIQGAILDGVPGDPDNAEGTHIQFNDNDGALLAVEVGYRDEVIGHYGIGVWQYTEEFDDWTETDDAGDPVQNSNRGIYALAERNIYTDPGNENRKIDGFARFGVSDGDVSQFDYSWSAGLVYSGAFESRPDGQFGLGVSGAKNSDKFREANPSDSHETQLELTYSDKLTPWLSIQPDVQYTINPGTDPANSNALTIGLRLAIDL